MDPTNTAPSTNRRARQSIDFTEMPGRAKKLLGKQLIIPAGTPGSWHQGNDGASTIIPVAPGKVPHTQPMPLPRDPSSGRGGTISLDPRESDGTFNNGNNGGAVVVPITTPSKDPQPTMPPKSSPVPGVISRIDPRESGGFNMPVTPVKAPRHQPTPVPRGPSSGRGGTISLDPRERTGFGGMPTSSHPSLKDLKNVKDKKSPIALGGFNKDSNSQYPAMPAIPPQPVKFSDSTHAYNQERMGGKLSI